MKKWTVAELDKNMAKQLTAAYGLSTFTAMLLTIRRITAREEIERFFSQEITLDDPLLIKDMDKAVERIKYAVRSYEKICVYGDYDCDGVTSTAILYSYLESVFANVMYYIPDRNAEGYGMNKGAVEKLHADGVRLIITVDNGISAIDEINYANSLGMEVVVTDHHKPLDILPKAVAVVNPHRTDETYSFIDYSGAGLALKLITALEGDSFSIMENYSDLAALGTVADIVPLCGENRDIVKAGIFNLENTERLGLAALIEKAGVSAVNSGSIGFRLAPRINAAGRLGSPYDALSLFLTEDDELAEKNSELLNTLNAERQSIESEISKSIIEKLKENPCLTYNRVLVISSPGWNAGVIGIVSSRITERFGKPSIVISEDGEVCKASGRSVSGFSLVDAVFACSGHLEKYGGHPMAVGFSIRKENIEAFTKAINDYANQQEYMPLASLKLDCNLNPDTIVIDMVHQLKVFEPFGCGNPKPVFGLKGMRLDRITPVGGGKHLKLSVSRNQSRFSLMRFSLTAEEFPYQEGDLLDFAVNLDSNIYQGRESLSFNVKDIRLSDFNTDQAMYELQDYDLYKSGVITKHIADKYPTRQEFASVYLYLKKNPKELYAIDSLCYRLRPAGIGVFKLLFILDIMKELYLIDYSRDADSLYIHIREVSGKVDLKASRIYRKLEEDIKNAR
ncbi:MAG: single-stranded-DNA-specific exonuclease RecJ [Clostridia bacterium]|nr:single-stranded-DNA-specific exonuclease RecJ [Clostridia bacterium]